MNHLTPNTIATQFIDPTYAQLSLTEQVKLLGISRGSLYYTAVPIDPETLALMHRIDKIHTDWPTYGTRTIAAQLRRDTEIEIGRKRVRTLMEEMGIAAIYQKPNLSKNGASHPVFPYLLKGVKVIRPNQVWGTDITYIRLHGGFVYLVAYLDWYSRYVVSWKLSTTLEQGFVLEAAQDALGIGIPEIINGDQGVQFTSHEYIGLWDQERTKISMDHKGRCFDNIFTERFWRTLKYDEVYLKDYQTVWDAKANIGDFIRRYNTIRLHESLGYKTPAEFYFGKN
jgi:putative transposase